MLTRREKQIIEHVTMGFTIAEISKKLNISENTVKTHKENIQEKLQAKNSCHAVFLYLKQITRKKKS
jgi:LuxR family maltose regulon positive regulatory protein